MTVFSRFLFETLDSIGYNQDLVRLRRKFWQQFIKEFAIIDIPMLFAGSKAEGLTAVFQSDIDILSVYNDAICTDNVAQFSQLPDITVLHADTSETPPGYTRLKIVTICEGVNEQELKDDVFESESNEFFLSSAFFASSVKRVFTQFWGNNIFKFSGPAIQGMADIVPFDIVVGFLCYYPQLLQSWKLRQRHHSWPPEHVMEEAASMLGQVVPVGSKGSCDQWREWRFCFIESELKLTYSLNETQLKLYIVLKMVAKEILRKVSDEISSYIIKNVVYWLSELLPLPVFSRDNLFSLVLLSLRFLKSALSEWNWFPYYMIPGRDLLAERLTPANRRELSGLIDSLIQEGPQILLRCTKLRTAFNLRLQTPALLIRYRKTRDQQELLLFYQLLGLMQYDETLFTVLFEHGLFDYALSEMMISILHGVPEENIYATMVEMLS